MKMTYSKIYNLFKLAAIEVLGIEYYGIGRGRVQDSITVAKSLERGSLE